MQPCLLAVHAHPDDEASKGAPTVAMYHAAGAHTVLVCCTGGEEGDVNNPSLREPGAPFFGLTRAEERAALIERRPLELARSAELIGFDDVIMLGYRDSGMNGAPSNDDPACFHQADLDEATGRLVAVVRRERPQVILAYGDDHRFYPHPDHIRAHEIAVLAYERSGDPAWYPEAGEPWSPSKLYYTVWSKARLIAVHEALLARRGSSPYDENWLGRPDQDERITTRLDVGRFLWARTDALHAHATQIDPDEPWWFGLSDEELAEVFPWEDWVLARSSVGEPAEGEWEDDLFAGLPEAAVLRAGVAR